MRIAFVSLAGLVACAPSSSPPDEALMLMAGYRDPADQCRRVAETVATVEYLDDAADLVACPEDGENIGVFVTETGAVEVTRIGGYILYSVPFR